MKFLRFCLLGLVALTVEVPLNAAAPFSEIVVFGDSTVDTGNSNFATEGLVNGPPYFDGNASNGRVWVEVLAKRLKLQAPKPSLKGGSNYAWPGAETGNGLSAAGTPNLGKQITSFLDDRGKFTGDELIVVAAGANDVVWDELRLSAKQIVKNLSRQIAKLAEAGGRTFLVANISPYGPSPLFRGTEDEDRIDKLVANVNRLLDSELSELARELQITIVRLDVNGLLSWMLDSPAFFGLTNVTDAAFPGGGFGIFEPDALDTLVENPDDYLWWDLAHWTGTVHEIIGDVAFLALGLEDR